MKSLLLAFSIGILFTACERHSAEETAPFHEEHHGKGHGPEKKEGHEKAGKPADETGH